jgi:DNA invertase Pin-like site-specific DNA recombinase
MRAALYARVSTLEDQNPETQLLPLREYVQAQGWSVAGEFVDRASATNLRGRPAWTELLALASRRKVHVILIWKLDRAFRSVVHASTTVEQLRRWGVGLRSLTESWLDTSASSPWGDLLFNIMASFAQFERALIAERVRAGMTRAKKQGKHLGRPYAVNGEWAVVRPRVLAGEISERQAAALLRVSPRTVGRLLRHNGHSTNSQDAPETQGNHAVPKIV